MLHIPQGTAHMRILLCTWRGSRRGPWSSLVLYLDVTIGAQWAVDSAIGTGFYKLLSVFANLYPPHMPQFDMPTIGNHRNNSKIAPISHYLVPTSTGKALALVASYAILARWTRVIKTRDTQSVPHHNLASSHFAHQQAVSYLLGERQEAQILKFNAPPLHT